MPAPRNSTDLIGKRFGRVQVVSWGGHKVNGSLVLTCFCDCGTWKRIKELDLMSGHSRSCGCLHREGVSRAMKTHGLSRSKEHRVWRSMKERCYNPSFVGFLNYGGRGIRVCDRWLDSFENFYEDMGPKPRDKHSIDRFPDGDGDYEPGNCRWATRLEQARNTRRNLLCTFQGVTMCLSEWSEKLGIRYGLLIMRIQKLKWSPEKAFTTPKKRWRDK